MWHRRKNGYGSRRDDHHLGGTYYVRKSPSGNIILRNDHFKATLKPAIVDALVEWLEENQKSDDSDPDQG